jgi:hypothetical protein
MGWPANLSDLLDAKVCVYAKTQCDNVGDTTDGRVDKLAGCKNVGAHGTACRTTFETNAVLPAEREEK